MTHEGPRERSLNRILTVLVVITILVVAYWATNGGLDSIVLPEPESVGLAD